MTSTGDNRQRYTANVETAPSRFSNEGQDYREWAARADKFAQAWSDQELIDALAPKLTCIEAESISYMLEGIGYRAAAAAWIVAHASDDEPEEREAHNLTAEHGE